MLNRLKSSGTALGKGTAAARLSTRGQEPDRPWPPCPDAQADGVPCDDVHADCEHCGRGAAERTRRSDGPQG